MKKLDGRVAIVTGAARGLGEAAALGDQHKGAQQISIKRMGHTHGHQYR